jgi:uncharacterized protein (TIGR03492 family)
MKLLVISNGHGEDIIAVRILEELVNCTSLEIAALPIVGQGYAFTKAKIAIAGKVKQMPSGGFIYQDGRQLWRDLQGGLLQLTLEQYQVVRQWGRDRCFILAVGDLVPLLFAWLSGTNYAFVGTAKSEYYLRDDRGWLSRTSWIERKFGSDYLPWERFLMSHPRCQAVFPRDSLTTQVLQKWSIPALDLGNPMMDGIISSQTNPMFEIRQAEGSKSFISPITQPSAFSRRDLIVLLLPGSRMPEAESNWQKILVAVDSAIASFVELNLIFLAAIAPALNLDSFEQHLPSQNWHSQPLDSVTTPISDPQRIIFAKHQAKLVLTQNAYADCLVNSNLAIAMAGTATEQFVGLGKPVFTFSGEGPQFTYAFAEAQTRLLGESVILVDRPDLVGGAIDSVFNNRDRLEQIAINGKRRMGEPGAAKRIAQCLLEQIFSTESPDI